MTQATNQGAPPGPAGNENAGTGQHPAWDEILSFIPDESKAVATEKLRAWDSGVNERFTKLHSEYEPYKSVIGEYQPDDVKMAIQLATSLQENPQAFYEQLQQAYGFDSGQGPGNQNNGGQQPGNNGSPQELFADNPELQQFLEDRFGRFEQALGVLAENMLQSQQTMTQKEEDAALDQALAELHKNHGEFDEDFVLAKVARGVDPDEAVQQFQKLTGGSQQNGQQQQVPPILGGSTGLPTGQIDPAKLDSRNTQELVARLLEASERE